MTRRSLEFKHQFFEFPHDGGREFVHVLQIMKPIRSLVIATFLAAGVCSLRADLTILQEISMPDAQMPSMSTTTKIKDQMIRIDTGGKASMILDGNTGDMTSLMPEQKVAIPMNAAFQKMAAKMAKANQQPGDSAPDFKPTGRKQTLLGFECEEFTATMSKQSMTIWVTQAIPESEQMAKQFEKFGAQFKQFQSPAQAGKIKGLPLLTEITDDAGKKTTIRVQAISRDAIAAKDFEIPRDYKKMELPQMPTDGE